MIKLSESVQLSVVTADKAYDSEDNHVLVRDVLHALSVIPARYEHILIRKTHGGYSKQIMSVVIIANCCTINETRMKPYFQ
jgi:chromosome condensin MukBEF MukE localization factor